MTARQVLVPILLFLNALVLLGQIWPEGAPPSARAVNIVVLAATVLYFLLQTIGQIRANRKTRF